MTDFTDTLCIAIASHISNENRIPYFIECLRSLTEQTLPIHIYISMSLETEQIKNAMLNSISKNSFIESYGKITLVIREHKTPQMRHVKLIYEEVKMKHKWIMFCDDDDTYLNNRVHQFAKYIYSSQQQCSQMPGKTLGGVYESSFGKDHREHRHEYWCYCVNVELLGRFYDGLREHPDVVDNRCCDVLFAEYLRRTGPDILFSRIEEKLYNYRVEGNGDSITGFIQSKQAVYTRPNSIPHITDPGLPDYILDWNDYLHENLDVYIHDVFLRTLVGCDLEYILRAEFRADYDLLKFVDACHVEKIKDRHQYWRSVCDKLYDLKL
jgi:hypothetical protein